MSATTLATAADMRAIAGDLAAAGMEARLEVADGYPYVHATAPGTGKDRAFEVFLDDDGHIELRWQHQPAVPPAPVAAAVTRAIAAITAGTGAA